MLINLFSFSGFRFLHYCNRFSDITGLNCRGVSIRKMDIMCLKLLVLKEYTVRKILQQNQVVYCTKLPRVPANSIANNLLVLAKY